MKKHQLAAMVLSALSAGVLISCTKPNDEAKNQLNNQEVETKKSQSEGGSKEAQPIKAIEINSATAKSYLTHIANDQIISAYQNSLEQSRALSALASQNCQEASSVNGESLEALRAQWLELAKAWAQAEVVGFGPAMNSMSNLYINYYPDERGLVHQGVKDLINSNPNITAEQLSAESAIVQGIPGLEEVLFSNESINSEQCQYVISASEALTERLNGVVQAWESSSEQLLGINDNDHKSGINRWINSVLALVETTKSTSLDQPLGITGNKKGHLPAATAGHSRDIITAKVAALNKALTDPALVAILSDNGKDTVSNEISTLLADTTTLLAQLPEELGQATPEQQKTLYEKLTQLTQVIKHQLMPTLGVQVGFNSTDGD